MVPVLAPAARATTTTPDARSQVNTGPGIDTKSSILRGPAGVAIIVPAAKQECDDSSWTGFGSDSESRL